MSWGLLAALLATGFVAWRQWRSKERAQQALWDTRRDITVLEAQLETARQHGRYFKAKAHSHVDSNKKLRDGLREAVLKLETTNPDAAGELVRARLRRLLSDKESHSANTRDLPDRGSTNSPGN